MPNSPEPVFIVAEAGVNHNGDRDLAFQLVEVAAESGADAIKFQTFDVEQLVTRSASKAAYQKNSTDPSETQLEMLEKLQLDNETHHALKQHSEKNGLQFMSTAFDSRSLAFLAYELELDILKIPSGEVTNGPLLLEYARTGRNIILSTGMSTLDEVRVALSVLAFGATRGIDPSIDSFASAFNSEKGQKALSDRVILLHCTTEYPAPIDSINLRAMVTLGRRFGLKVGYSDHSEGLLVPCAAVALGAVVIEKHFTLDRSLPGPDHGASLEPEELRRMIDAVRTVEVALGSGKKSPQDVELANRDIARKSLVATSDIEKGECFTEKNLTIKRPGTGRSPMEFWDYIGSCAQRHYSLDELID
jgi:N-acetylneuraminate synthase